MIGRCVRVPIRLYIFMDAFSERLSFRPFHVLLYPDQYRCRDMCALVAWRSFVVALGLLNDVTFSKITPSPVIIPFTKI